MKKKTTRKYKIDKKTMAKVKASAMKVAKAMRVKTKKAKAKKPVKTVKAKKEKLELINMKLTKQQHQDLKARAKKFTKGNVSLWLRVAGANYVPRPKDLENFTL